MSSDRLFKQGYHHMGASQELQPMALNNYGRVPGTDGIQLAYGGERGNPKSTGQPDTGYYPNGVFPANEAGRLQNYYAREYNPVYNSANAVNSFSNLSQSGDLPPPPPYEAHTQSSPPSQQTYEKQEKCFDGQNYWTQTKTEEVYEQPIKRMRVLSNEDLKSESD